MSHESPTPDQDLRHLKACPLDDAFLDRLQSCAEGTDLELRDDEIEMERELRAMRPSRLERDLISQLSTITVGVPFAADEKIVLFPTKDHQAPASARRSLWKAAAAVALIGGAAALIVPHAPENSKGFVAGPATNQTPPTIATERIPSAGSSHFAPANFNRGLAEARDEGVVWHAPHRPHRVVRVVYLDRISMINEEGKTIQVEQPRVEYILVPEKID